MVYVQPYIVTKRSRAAALGEQLLLALDEWNTGGHEKLTATKYDPMIAAMIRNGAAHLAADAELLSAIAEGVTGE